MGGREEGKERKGKGAGVGEEKRPGRRGVAWGLSQSSNIVGKTPKIRGLYAARQCGNEQ